MGCIHSPGNLVRRPVRSESSAPRARHPFPPVGLGSEVNLTRFSLRLCTESDCVSLRRTLRWIRFGGNIESPPCMIVADRCVSFVKTFWCQADEVCMYVRAHGSICCFCRTEHLTEVPVRRGAVQKRIDLIYGRKQKNKRIPPRLTLGILNFRDVTRQLRKKGSDRT